MGYSKVPARENERIQRFIVRTQTFVRQQSLERFCKNAAKISWAHRQPRNHDAKRALESSGAHDNTHARTARPLWTCKAPENRLLCFFDNTVCSFGASFAAACHSSRARHKAPTCCPTCPPSESPAQSPADQSRRASNRQATRRARCPPAWPPAQTPPSRLPAATDSAAACPLRGAEFMLSVRSL